MCDRAIEMGAKKREDVDCSKCKFVIPLMPENMETVFYINEMEPGLTAFGKINYEAVRMVFEVYQVPEERRVALWTKVQAYVGVVLEHMADKAKEAM